jgi:hypothetical protein
MVRGYNPAGSRRRAAHARRYPAWDIRKSSAGGVFGSSHRSGGMADRLTGWIVYLFQAAQARDAVPERRGRAEAGWRSDGRLRKP